jgi:hypothetical protein
MTLVSVVESPLYLARAEGLISESEREHVIDRIAADPNAGVRIKGLSGFRKMRIPLQGRGKRGGGRVVYWFHSTDYPAVLLLLFAKNAAADLTVDERKRLAALGMKLMAQFGGEE